MRIEERPFTVRLGSRTKGSRNISNLGNLIYSPNSDFLIGDGRFYADSQRASLFEPQKRGSMRKLIRNTIEHSDFLEDDLRICFQFYNIKEPLREIDSQIGQILVGNYSFRRFGPEFEVFSFSNSKGYTIREVK